MQASCPIYHLASSPFISSSSSPKITSNTLFPNSHKRIQPSSSTWISMKAAASSSDTPWPPQACDTLGGVACDVDMFPETKLKQVEANPPKVKVTLQPGVDREYLEYDSPKTVGGEFCEPTYESGAK